MIGWHVWLLLLLYNKILHCFSSSTNSSSNNLMTIPLHDVWRRRAVAVEDGSVVQ